MRTGLRRLVISVVAAVAIVAMGWAFTQHQSSEDELPGAIEHVSPPRNAKVLRQTDVVADLRPGYSGRLYLDNREIPDDDLQRVPALNTITLRPTDDSDYKQLSPGRHCAAVEYWRTVDGPEAVYRHGWCFNLH